MIAPAPGVKIVTLGCRLNIVESEAMRKLASAGARDTVVINTCAVTAEAERRSRQAVRRVLREDAQARVVVTGCASEIARDDFARLSDRVEIVPNAGKTDARHWGETRPSAAQTIAPSAEADEAARVHTRGFVAVQNGCDHRCTFCIIPFGRGASRSLAASNVVAQVRMLVDAGHADIILTGVDLTSWGNDIGAGQKLGDLVRTILREVRDLKRLRLSSLDCIEADATLLDAFANEQRLMPHLHLSLQSGDDLILKRMKRRHSRDDAVRFCALLRELRPDIVFGADLIAGFPTETEAMFLDTLALADDCGLTHLHVFPYSQRPGTPAARMPPVAGPIIAERAARLRAVGARRLACHLDAQVGREVEVLVERGAIGRAPDFSAVRVQPSLSPGDLAMVRIAAHDGERLLSDGRTVAA